MPMPTRFTALREYLRRPENVSIGVAVAVAMPLAVAVDQWLHWEGLGFLLLFGLGVLVPTAFRDHWQESEPAGAVAVWTFGACAIGAVAVVGGTLLLGTYAGLAEFVAAAVAFRVVGLGGSALVWLVAERRGD